ncbi:hypothetical protein J6590_073235 [Homalodisca vitripennis]|nr:hypothetical protein J6590_073235 [Homalodisca vitripennis]
MSIVARHKSQATSGEYIPCNGSNALPYCNGYVCYYTIQESSNERRIHSMQHTRVKQRAENTSHATAVMLCRSVTAMSVIIQYKSQATSGEYIPCNGSNALPLCNGYVYCCKIQESSNERRIHPMQRQ